MAKKDVTNYLANPINTFKIIKRLHLDWIKTENIVWNHIPAGKDYEMKIYDLNEIPKERFTLNIYFFKYPVFTSSISTNNGIKTIFGISR